MTKPRIYLRSIHLERFGRFHDTVVGPFGDRMNIVLGANEAGKTTVASFVGGVLFGWEEARGNRNTYKPRGPSERARCFSRGRQGRTRTRVRGKTRRRSCFPAPATPTACREIPSWWKTSTRTPTARCFP